MLADAVPLLRCPHCGQRLTLDGAVVRCATGHAFDVARHGYVNLLTGGRRPPGDPADLVTHRDAVLTAGHFGPLTAALVDAAGDLPAGCVLDVGAGTGHHLAAVLRSHRSGGTPRVGIAVDTSTPALRRAARAHPDVAAVGADAWARWPLADGVAAAVMVVFAPRNPGDVVRVLAPGGVLLVTTPLPEHLRELAEPLGLLAHGLSAEETADAFGLRAEVSRTVRWTMHLDRGTAAALALMGPSGFHLDAGDVGRRLSQAREPVRVTGAVTVTRMRRGS